eukprot:gb/GECG01000990.1/.p1 GENE.gb/GECG01000990.1/~~gb/GECG01000990.1/.p1  ORF type:complete len:570 (+),score=110.18 gb/GECG01000990.1/:1-1710(+)
MEPVAYQARQAVRRVETYSMVRELVLDVAHDAEKKALQQELDQHSLTSSSLKDSVRDLRQKHSDLQLQYAKFVKGSEQLRFELESQLWCAAREIEIKKKLEEVAEQLRQRVLQQHETVQNLNRQVKDQNHQLEVQARRIRQQRPSGEQHWFHLPAKVVVHILKFLHKPGWVALASTSSCMYSRLDAIIGKHFPKGVRFARGQDTSRYHGTPSPSPQGGLGSGLALENVQSSSQRRILTPQGPASSPRGANRSRHSRDTEESASVHSGEHEHHHQQQQQQTPMAALKKKSGSGLFGVSRNQGIDAKEASRWLAHMRQLDSELAKARAQIEDLDQKLKTVDQVKKYLVEQRDEAEAKAAKAKEEADSAKEQTKSDRQVLKLLDNKLKETEKALSESRSQAASYKNQLEELNSQFEKEIRAQVSEAKADDTVAQLKAEVSRLKFQLRNRDSELNEAIQQRDHYREAYENKEQMLREQQEDTSASEEIKELKSHKRKLVKEVKRLRLILEENGLGNLIKSKSKSTAGDVVDSEGESTTGRENGSTTRSPPPPPASKKGNPFAQPSTKKGNPFA